MKKYWDDVLILGGGIFIMAGFWFTWRPAVLFSAGVMLIVLAIMIGVGSQRPERKK